MRDLLSLLLAVALLPVPPPAISVVEAVSGGSSSADLTLTFAGNWTPGNCVVVAATVNSSSVTLDLTGISETETVVTGPVDNGGLTNSYIWVFTADGSADLDVIVTRSISSGSVRAVAAVVSGATCSAEDVESNTDSSTPYNLTTDLTVTSGAFVLAFVHSTSASNFSCDGAFTCIPTDGTDVGGVSLGQYQITSGAGSLDPQFTSASNESALLMGASFAASGAVAATPRLLLLGVGLR